METELNRPSRPFDPNHRKSPPPELPPPSFAYRNEAEEEELLGRLELRTGRPRSMMQIIAARTIVHRSRAAVWLGL